MNKKPSAKTVALFVATTPLLGLPLVMIQQSIQKGKTEKTLLATTVTATPVAATSTPIEQLLPVEGTFMRAAKVFWTDVPPPSQTYDNQMYRRATIVVTVPATMTNDVIYANLRAVARRAFQDGMHSVLVYAYKAGSGDHPGAKCIADLTFAPYGEWERTDRVYKIDEYETVIRHVAAPTIRTSIQGSVLSLSR